MNKIIQVLKNQKTTRRNSFSSKPIPDKLINIIKDSILKTPNASNRQSYSIIELDKESAIKLGFPGEYVFLFCIDFYRLKQLAKKLGKDIDTQYLMQYSTALIDISLITQTALIAAQSLGLDSLITNEVFHNKIEKLYSQLNIPDKHVFPMIALCLGYSNNENEADHGRLDPGVIFHKNRYQIPSDYDLNKIIDEYDDEFKNLGLSKNWKDNGFNHYLEWFFEKWFPVIGSRKQNEIFIKKLKETLIL